MQNLSLKSVGRKKNSKTLDPEACLLNHRREGRAGTTSSVVCHGISPSFCLDGRTFVLIVVTGLAKPTSDAVRRTL